MTCLLLCAALTISLPSPPTNYGFAVWYGPLNRTYATKVWVGYPAVSRGSTNFTATITIPPGTNFFALTVTNRQELESDFSNEATNTVPTNSVKLFWQWMMPGGPPATNIITVSAGTNFLVLTNPVVISQFWRLRGLSWTNAALQATDQLRGPWVTISTWNYSSNRTPALSILLSH